MLANKINCDVLVAGGGVAGVAAAVASARQGARSLLVERNGFLGGTATAAEVGTVCGLYLRSKDVGAPRLVAGGFLSEIAALIQQSHNTSAIPVQDGLWVLPCPALWFARVCRQLLNKTANTSLLLHSTIFDARVGNGNCKEVRVLAWNEAVTVRAKAMVDCTGEATVAFLSGCGTENGVGDQAPGLIFTLDGVDGTVTPATLLSVRRELRRAVENGILPDACERLALVPSRSEGSRIKGKLNLAPAARDARSWNLISRWECESRDLAHRVHEFLASTLPKFRNSRLTTIAPQLGVRSGRRLVGRARLEESAVLETSKQVEGVARGSWPMERWSVGLRPDMAFFAEGEYYDIPFGCLRARELENVWAAGRCFSSSGAAMTSARVIGTAMATGWAAGTAAAFQALGRAPEDSIEVVRRQMCE